MGPHHYGLLGVLTRRQIEVAVAVGVLGLSSKQAAARMGLSMRTIEQHRAAVLERVGCSSTVLLARRMALAELM